jgi:hypothetical protein
MNEDELRQRIADLIVSAAMRMRGVLDTTDAIIAAVRQVDVAWWHARMEEERKNERG